MKVNWMAWSVALALGLAAVAATAWAQEPSAPPREDPAAGEDPGFDDLDDFDGLELLLAADLPPGPGPGAGPGMHMGQGPAGHMGPGMGPGGTGPGDLHAKLNLTDEQKSKLADIHDRQARAAIPVQGNLRIAELDLHKLMRADKPDARAIDAQIDKIAGLRASLQKSHVAGMLEARSVLTPAQQKLLRESRRGMMMGRHMQGGRGMRGGPGRRMMNMQTVE